MCFNDSCNLHIQNGIQKRINNSVANQPVSASVNRLIACICLSHNVVS